MEFCSLCRTETDIDESNGDAICTGCGFVLGPCFEDNQTLTKKRKRRESEDSESDSESESNPADNQEYAFENLEYFPPVVTAGVEKELSGPRWYCSGLGMIKADVEAVEETIEHVKLKGFVEFIKKRPKAVEAGVVYAIGQLCSDRWTIEDVSKASDVEKGEIEETYEHLYHFVL